MKNEIRSIRTQELRAVEQDGVKRLRGLAIPYNVRSQDLGGFVEVAAPGLVTRSLREQPDVLALRDHNPEKLLARTTAGTLTLRDTPVGLAFDLALPDTETGRDTYENVRLGNLSGVSWGFKTRKDSWSNVDGQVVRTLEDIDLAEISPTSFPAYGKATSVSVRNCPPEIRSLLGDLDLFDFGSDDEDAEDDEDEDGKKKKKKSEDDEETDSLGVDAFDPVGLDEADFQRHAKLQLAIRRLRA
jgi:uncharacterized protein